MASYDDEGLTAKIRAIELGYANAILKKVGEDHTAFKAVREALEAAGVSVSAQTQVALPTIRAARVLFTRPGADETIAVKIFFYNYVDDGIKVWFDFSFTRNGTLVEKGDFVPLSCRSADEWRRAAAGMDFPEILRDAPRFTEFFLALVAPLGTAESFEQFYRGHLDTIQSGDKTYYAGHGGHMEVVFPIVFNDAGRTFGERFE